MINNTFAILAVLLLNGVLIEEVMLQGRSELYAENELIENLQACFYAGGFFCALWGLLHVQRFERWLGAAFSLACLTFFLREVDMAELNLPEVVKFFTGGTSKDLLLAFAFLALIVRFGVTYRQHLREFWTIVRTRIALFCIGGGALLVLGSLFEQTHHPFLEELVELDGALLILSAAILYALSPHRLLGQSDHPDLDDSRLVPSS
ncbi:MAG: hypothetical protein E1N59_467 [Puniceicoccaceae bacterium 5H]|nr:MAG: hypothetical protein E1N59_467 [Puniceicoccaceae bacterium 5H]